MKSQNLLLFVAFFLLAILSGCSNNEPPKKTVWFDKPAKYFEEAFPLGNGFIGMMVKGGVSSEDLILNESSLWTGGPVDPNMNPDAWKNLENVRKVLFSENYKVAEILVKKMQGKFSESYAPLGNLKMKFESTDSVTGYKRILDLSTGIASVDYTNDNHKFHRDFFVSNPDRVAVISLKSETPGTLNFTLFSTSLLKYKTLAEKNDFIMDGVAPIHADPNYVRNTTNPVFYDSTGKGMRFRMIARVVKTDGRTFADSLGVHVEKASEAVIILSIATSYNGFDKDPGLDGKDEKKIALDFLEKASALSYDALKSRHIQDFSGLFNRVSVSLNNATAPNLPINKRLMNYKDSLPDPELEALYFQFGRYLLISSSRPGGIPANLQGIWNPHLRPPWSSNFTSNINSEMNYWPAEETNLSETHIPLLQHIGNLSKTGQITARTFYNCRGWCCSHNTDIWAMTNPVGNFGNGDPVWANWSMAEAWYSLHLYDHFAFTGDTAWLKDYGWPLMKGAARFCLDLLVTDPKGYLVTAPSTSPENKFKMPDGYIGSTFYGGTADLALIKGLFNKILLISDALKTDSDLAGEVRNALGKMYPYQVGKKGNLQEWYYDWDDQDPQHRHISHLIGLYPDNQISPAGTPELAAAAKRSLELRGDGGTGWSKAWKINTWARLLDGNHAYKMLRTHLNYVSPSPDTRYSGGGTYPNLFDAHPPFQIDGNFGGTAGIAEMLLQSQNGYIQLLPALPDVWKEGYIKGLRARGGFTVDQYWKNGKLTKAIIYPDQNSNIRIKYAGKFISLKGTKGRQVEISSSLFN
jgi:alpha-L-fucosidase 2